MHDKNFDIDKSIDEYVKQLMNTYNMAEKSPVTEDIELENILNQVEMIENNEQFSEYGYLKVNVSTAKSAIPVENASVIITSLKDGDYQLIGSYTTDDSGQTELIKLPAKRDFYDLKVMKDGYFDFESLNLSVFDRVTSLQNCYMIPMVDRKVNDADFVVENG